MGIQIIVDSCCDTTPELRNRIGMLFAPLKVQVADGPQYTDTPALDTKNLLREMKASKQAAARPARRWRNTPSRCGGATPASL